MASCATAPAMLPVLLTVSATGEEPELEPAATAIPISLDPSARSASPECMGRTVSTIVPRVVWLTVSAAKVLLVMGLACVKLDGAALNVRFVMMGITAVNVNTPV